MPWNYRMMRQVCHDEIIYGIHEVYYDENGNVKNWTVNVLGPKGETYEDFIADFEHWMAAFDKPLLDEIELQNKQEG